MKYLKLFEDYYYDALKFNFQSTKRIVSIEDFVIKTIRKMGFNIITDIVRIDDGDFRYASILPTGKNSIEVDIYQYEDEWFEVEISNGKIYWCDQVEGLIKLIKDLSSINESQTFHQMNDDEVNYVYYKDADMDSGFLNVPEDFTNDEFEYLRSNYNNVSYADVDNRSIISINSNRKKLSPKIGDFFINIEKFEDEWYIIYYGYVTNGNIYRGSEVVRDLMWNYKWYKCDQWDGLIDCLNTLTTKNLV